MKRLLLFFPIVFFSLCSFAQKENPHATWSFSSKQVSSDEFDLVANVTIDKGWHLYSQFLDPNATPYPTKFTFDPSADYEMIGKTEEAGNKKSEYQEVDKLTETFFEDYAVFTQRVKIRKANVVITGNAFCQTCTDMCTQGDKRFTYNLLSSTFSDTKKSDGSVVHNPSVDSASAIAKKDSTDSDSTKAGVVSVISTTNDLEKSSYWGVFILGILAGGVALVMPCVWPVIPLTVSFFLKQNKNKRQGRINAVVYGLSITLIFVALGILVSLFTNPQKLNELSSSWFFNMLFFILFFLFSLSFLGMFEIRVPSSWINKSEQLSDKGGFLGIFFMAFTLVLVSFSCTLPFIGNLIKLVTDGGQFMKPLIGFTAFGLTLGLPFALFAYFPSLLQNLPKSGGWMTTVKVVFGFIELALCFIYLSKVDMAYHWGVISRDVFLAIWIMIFAVLGFYLLGKINLPHHEELNHISVPRLLVALTSLAFALYMVPGLWGAPLKSLSGFLPNYKEFEFSGGGKHLERAAPKFEGVKKYGELFHQPSEPDMDLFFDFDQAFAYSKKVKKPLFIDFTGHSCVNCRYNEQNVWPDPEVAKRLMNDFVCVSLYVDDKKDLAKEERYESKTLDKTVETIGDKNSDLQAAKFKLPLAQPYYVLLDNKGNLLIQPLGGKCEPDTYVNFLDEGLKKFRTAR